MGEQTSGKILRYQLSQRLIHWFGVVSFMLLLVTGLILEFSPLSFMAAGGTTRTLHRIGAVLYILWPIAYALLKPRQFVEVVKESLTYGRDEIEWFKHMPLYFTGRACMMPPQGRVNAGQKIHHLGVGIASITIVASGLILWIGKGELGPNGLAATAILHDLSMLVLTILFVGHSYFTFLYGALPAMISGYVTEEYARLEHSKWLASLKSAEKRAGSSVPVKRNN
jgi:formate dehydrogenase subunit gamma